MRIRDNLYHYKFQVQKVIDGDTIVGKLDKGRNNFDEEVHIRMLGIQAPEISKAKTAEERVRGYEAKNFLTDLILGKSVIVKTVKADDDDNFGRMLAIVYLPEKDDLDVNQYMIDSGHAVVYEA